MTSTLGIKKIQYPNGTNIATLDSSGSVAFAGASTIGGTLGVTGAAGFDSYITTTGVYGKTDGNSGIQFDGSDIVTLHTAGAERMRINAEGLVTKPLQCCFMAQPASLQSNLAVAGSGVNIDLGTERFDVGGDFASNTFTAPVTGKYALHALFYMNAVDSGTTYYEFTIKTSNRNYGLVVYVGAGGSTDHAYATWSSSVIADMDASDTAYLHYYQAGGTQQTDVSTGTYFMGYLLG